MGMGVKWIGVWLRACGYMGVWRCFGCMDAWEHGCTGACVCEWVGVWVYGRTGALGLCIVDRCVCVSAWAHGSIMLVWVHGCIRVPVRVGVWVCGCLGVWLYSG